VTEHPKSSREPAGATEPIVFVIDDDASMRRALTNLFQSVGLKVEVFGSAPEMLRSKLPDVASCLVLDIRLPGLSGLDFQTELAKANINIPIIFMTGHGDIPMTVRAMKGGAVDFLTKPFRDQDMLDAVVTAIERDRKRTGSREGRRQFERPFRDPDLPRAGDTGVRRFRSDEQANSGRAWTCRDHREDPSRAHHEEKGARSLADLVRKAETLGIHRSKP